MPEEDKSYVKDDRKGEKSIRVTAQPVKLPRAPKAQNKTGRGNPYK